VLAKDARLRKAVAHASRKIASTARLIDDIPTRTELIQYEKRFLELYAQVATKLDETKKYYELYNSLDEIVKVHAKEVTILNSILDTFQTATKSKQGKQSFLDQLDEMNSGLAKNLAKKKEGLKASGDRASEAHANHQALVEQHRNYHAAIKDFHDECQKNEMLLARVEEAG
jgi:chromosome segregation ATPase